MGAWDDLRRTKTTFWIIGLIYIKKCAVASHKIPCSFGPNLLEEIMRPSNIATILAVTACAAAVSGKPAEAQDRYHPETSAPVAAQSATPAQQGMGGMPIQNMMQMMHSMNMMGPGMAGMGTIDRVEGRIAFLQTELKITDSQASTWNAFADALRTNPQKLAAVRPTMMSPQAGSAQQPSLTERLDVQEQWFAARLESTRAIKAAFTTLYGTLSDDQKKTANEILAPHMGMMNTQTGGGQMGMGPGQMRLMQPSPR
jgi:hypothetical protein